MADNIADHFAYNLVDEAIEKYIMAEQSLRFHLTEAYKQIWGNEPDDIDLRHLQNRRFKSVICKLAAKKYKGKILILAGKSDQDHLQHLAENQDCPRALWQ